MKIILVSSYNSWQLMTLVFCMLMLHFTYLFPAFRENGNWKCITIKW